MMYKQLWFAIVALAIEAQWSPPYKSPCMHVPLDHLTCTACLPCICLFLQRTLLSRLHQANIFVDQNVPDAAPLLPHKLSQQAMQAHVAQAADPNTSQLQRDVGAILGLLLNVSWSRVRLHVCNRPSACLL
jgi:hypothetical protein